LIVPELALKFEGSPSKPKTPATRHSAPAALAAPSISEADSTTKTTTALKVTKPTKATASSSTKAVASKSTDAAAHKPTNAAACSVTDAQISTKKKKKSTTAAALKPTKAAASSSIDVEAPKKKNNNRLNYGDWEFQKDGGKLFRPEKNKKNWQVVDGVKTMYVGPMSLSMLNKKMERGELTPEQYRDLYNTITTWDMPAPVDPSLADIVSDTIGSSDSTNSSSKAPSPSSPSSSSPPLASLVSVPRTEEPEATSVNCSDWELQEDGGKLFRPENNNNNWKVVDGVKNYVGPISLSMLKTMSRNGELTPEEYRDFQDSITNWDMPAPVDPSLVEIVYDTAFYPMVDTLCGTVWGIITGPFTAANAVASCFGGSDEQKKMEEAADIETGTPVTPSPPSPTRSCLRSLRALPRKLVKAARESFVSVCYAPMRVYEGANSVCTSLWVAGGGKEDCCIV
jgi:hypothetical protein